MAYYQHDLALVHARGYSQHADSCAPGILDLLSPVLGGLVLELGCGAGALTRHLLAAGHRVIATDASPDMLEQARAALGPDADLRRLVLPDDPLPAADGAGAWRRDSERHENILVDTSGIPALLAGHGVEATVGSSFGAEALPPGLRVVTGVRR
jgi:SAM-dependent methyltransferase